MSDSNTPSFFARVIHNDVTKKGIAGALTSLLIATVLELWPSRG